MRRKVKMLAARLASMVMAFALLTGVAHAQSSPLHYLSAASTNSTLVKTGRVLLNVLLPINTTSTIYYLKLYDKATAPTCGTDIPVFTVPVPQASGAGGGVALPSPDGIRFGKGLGFCLTGGIADNDTTIAATGVAINLGVSGN